MKFNLDLPIRTSKPRVSGLTILIDNGVPLGLFQDTINSNADMIDFVKFGWGTSLLTKQLEEKILTLKNHEIDYFFGGTLFEKFLHQHQIEQYFQYCKYYDCKYVEISNGTLPISNKEKASYISGFSRDFQVFSEVGHKDCSQSSMISPEQWLEFIHEDLEAGVTKVITEARESGTSGICSSNGDIKENIIDNILSSSFSIDDIIFEAPTKQMQSYFITQIGPNVNLANIAFSDAIPLETLRLGLRSDTFYMRSEQIERNK